jgi:hypothetical protein
VSIAEWLKLLSPVAIALGLFGIRLEVGQALTKQRLREIEKDIVAAQASSEKGIEGVHARLGRHETDTKAVLSEIRGDVKMLLQRKLE